MLFFQKEARKLVKDRGKNLRATLFVISQFVGRGGYMEWSQIREVVSSGLVLVGLNHPYLHPYLTNLFLDELKNQIVSAKSKV